jgi:pyridoxal phosphate enzyme (YggS family)
LPSLESDFAQNLALVEERIQRAAERSGRPRASITLLAVSKKFPAERLAIAYQAGLREFGENYVQEFAEKRPALTQLADARYHLIGHLQSNKTRLACQLFQVIQTIDSPKLLQRLESSAAERGETTEVMIEVKLAAEESKSGAGPAQIPTLLEVAAACPHVTLTGLMTIPPWSDDPEHARPYFRQLAGLARQYHLPKLSMGMSGDLETAIEEGSTMVRVGTALFGKRPKSPST